MVSNRKRFAIAAAFSGLLVVAGATAGYAYDDFTLNPAEGGTATLTSSGCKNANQFKRFASEAAGNDFASTRDLGGYCTQVRVQIYYVASNGAWAGWSNIVTTNGDVPAYIETSGNLDRSWHAGA